METKSNKALIDELRELANYERRVCEENNFASAYASVMERAAAVIEELMRSNDRLAARIIEGVMTSDVVAAYDGSALEDADKHIEMLEGDVERLNKENFGQSMLICSLRDDLRQMTAIKCSLRDDLNKAQRARDQMKAERDALLEDVKGDCKCCANADTFSCSLCLKRIFWKWRGVQKKEENK